MNKETRADEIVRALKCWGCEKLYPVCDGCEWHSAGEMPRMKDTVNQAASLIISLRAQLTDKTALLDAAVAGQETLQKALAESQQRERAADDLAVSFIENGPYEDANTTALEFARGIMELCGPQQAGEETDEI